jgi:hypothetical protein
MTEAEWLACIDPQPMLLFLSDRGMLTDRRARLFAGACCRRIWAYFPDSCLWETVDLSDRLADGAATEEAFQAGARRAREYAESEEGRATEVGCSAAYAAASLGTDYAGERSVWMADRTAESTRNTAYWIAYEARAAAGLDEQQARAAGDTAQVAEGKVQTELVREVVGNPFSPRSLDPSWLTWNAGTVVRLAEVAYEERGLPSGHLDRVKLAVLADALEQAGCREENVLGHLRGGGPCVRGCHVVDLLLSKA